MGTLHNQNPVLMLTLLLASALLVGCLGAEDPTPAPPESGVPENAEGAVVTETTGAITGTVASTGFEPLAGATLTLLTETRDATGVSTFSARDGTFTLSQLEPARYILHASAIGYESMQRHAVVEPGKVTQVDIRLSVLLDDGPFMEEWEEVGVVSTSAAWHAEVPTMGCVVIPGTSGVGKTCGNIRFGAQGNFEMDLADTVKTILVEMVWTPAGALGESLRLELICPHVPRGTNGAVEDLEHVCYFDSPAYHSPIIHRIDEAHWLENDYNHTGIWDGRIFAGPRMLGTYGTTGADAGVAYQQAFTVYISLFHREGAPAGYSRIQDS